jgi:hypothetical protein
MFYHFYILIIKKLLVEIIEVLIPNFEEHFWKPIGMKFVRTGILKISWNFFLKILKPYLVLLKMGERKNWNNTYKCYWKPNPTILNKNWELLYIGLDL